MKNQIIFLATALIGLSYLSAKAENFQVSQPRKTATGRSSWTIFKGVAKIVIGAPIAFASLKGVIAFPVIALAAEGDAALLGVAGTVVSAGFLVGGCYLTYSGIQDLNEGDGSGVEATSQS